MINVKVLLFINLSINVIVLLVLLKVKCRQTKILSILRRCEAEIPETLVDRVKAANAKLEQSNASLNESVINNDPRTQSYNDFIKAHQK